MHGFKLSKELVEVCKNLRWPLQCGFSQEVLFLVLYFLFLLPLRSCSGSIKASSVSSSLSSSLTRGSQWFAMSSTASLMFTASSSLVNPLKSLTNLECLFPEAAHKLTGDNPPRTLLQCITAPPQWDERLVVRWEKYHFDIGMNIANKRDVWEHYQQQSKSRKVCYVPISICSFHGHRSSGGLIGEATLAPSKAVALSLKALKAGVDWSHNGWKSFRAFVSRIGRFHPCGMFALAGTFPPQSVYLEFPNMFSCLHTRTRRLTTCPHIIHWASAVESCTPPTASSKLNVTVYSSLFFPRHTHRNTFSFGCRERYACVHGLQSRSLEEALLEVLFYWLPWRGSLKSFCALVLIQNRSCVATGHAWPENKSYHRFSTFAALNHFQFHFHVRHCMRPLTGDISSGFYTLKGLDEQNSRRLNQAQEKNDATQSCGKHEMHEAAAGMTKHTALQKSLLFYYKKIML